MKFFLTEDLTTPVLSRYSSLINSADLCWALRLPKYSFSVLTTLNDIRWQVGDTKFFEAVEAPHAMWTNKVVMEQRGDGNFLSTMDQALINYGLEKKLWLPAIARGLMRATLTETGCRLNNLNIDLVASDPYLRDSLECFAGQMGSVRMHRTPRSLPVFHRVREKIAGNSLIRSMGLSYQGRTNHWRKRSKPYRSARNNNRTVGIFVMDKHWLDLFQPVFCELESRGWSVSVFYYNQLVKPAGNAESFARAVASSQAFVDDRDQIIKPRWTVSDGLLSESPVSWDWLKVALDVSWMTAKVQVKRHLCLLEARRPSVVISFGPEVMSLALQAAAQCLGIPSLLMNHTFREPARSSWFYHATASVMLGQACVEGNMVDRNGQKQLGLVATGHAPYDAMLKRSENSKGQRVSIPSIPLSAERPYLVLAFALWSDGIDYFLHLLQRRTLMMLAQALPHDAFLVYKLHPAFEEREACEVLLGSGLPSNAFKVVGESDCKTPDLLAGCHVAVNYANSTTLADTIIMGRPAIAVIHPELDRGSLNMKHPAWRFKGAWWEVEDSVQLRKALYALTRDEEARNELLRHRKQYIERFLVASDGQASERVADLVEHLGMGKEPSSFISTVGNSLLV